MAQNGYRIFVIFLADLHGRGSRVIKASDSGWPCHEFEPTTTKNSPCRAAMHVKSVESSNFLPLTATAGSDVVQSGRPIFDDFSNICGRISAITRRMLSSK
ncbi:hypothetical protein TNCV_198091 [Trichonephila clavipes]|nr:hypothetical protein TNCV_198091 [Trichonephila clavipes]